MFPWQISRSSFKLWRSEHKLFRKKTRGNLGPYLGALSKNVCEAKPFFVLKAPDCWYFLVIHPDGPSSFLGLQPLAPHCPSPLGSVATWSVEASALWCSPPGFACWWNPMTIGLLKSVCGNMNQIWMKYEDEQSLRVWWSLELAALFRVPISCCVWYSVIHR